MQVTVKAIDYKIGKMNAMKQFHVMRRLTPLLGEMASVQESQGAKLEELLPVVAKAFSSLSDEDSEYIFNQCLNVLERQEAGGSWHKVRHAGATMYTLSLMELMQLSYEVLQYNFKDFFTELGLSMPLLASKQIVTG